MSSSNRNPTSPEVLNISAPTGEGTSTQASSGTIGGGTTTAADDKLLNKYTSNLFAETSKIKLETSEHAKRLNFLRKEAEKLEKTDWQYDPVEKLLGK